MDDDFFIKLNDIFDKWLDLDINQVYFNELQNIVLLARLVIDNTPNIDDIRVLEEYININDTIKLVIDFFERINPDYAYRIQNIISQEKNVYNGKEDYSVKFYSKNKVRDSSIESDGRVKVSFDNTIADSISLAHEMTHKLSSPYEQNSFIKLFLVEVSSIEIELLLYDYLINNNLYKKDINSRMIDRFLNVYNSACNVLFEYTLLKLYIDNDRYISKQIFMDYIRSMDKSSKLFNIFINLAPKHLLFIYNTESLIFNVSQMYVIGLVLACDFHRSLKNNKNVLNELFKLIDILGKGHPDLNDIKVLQKFIPIIGNSSSLFDINDDVLNRLTESYKSELEELLVFQENLNKGK